jgi:hypothetical protein
MSAFNQLAPAVPTLINASNVFVFGNTSTGNALSVQQLGAGNVFSFSNASGRSNVFVMNNLGYVGVGTTSISYPLDVASVIQAGIRVISSSTATSSATPTLQSLRDIPSTDVTSLQHMLQFECGRASDQKRLAIGVMSDGGGHIQVKESSVGYYKLCLNPVAGNVGIGTTNPGAQLHVYGAGQATQTAFSTTGNLGGSLMLQDSGASAYNGGAIVLGANQGYFAVIKGLLRDGTTNTVGDISIATRNAVADATLTNRVYIQYNGNVGIGTTNPGASLDINGFKVNAGAADSAGYSFTAQGSTSANWSTGSGSTLLTLPGPGTGTYFNQCATFLVQCASIATSGQYAAAIVTCNSGGANLTQTINQIGATLSISSGQVVRLYWSYNATVTMMWTYTRIF